MNKQAHQMLSRLEAIGISTDDALALRRISMTLHRWFELECGDSNSHASWCITRGRFTHPVIKGPKTFEHDDDGKPFIERHQHDFPKTTYSPIPDRERGAKKRLTKIMVRYPTLQSYIQTDPRGCALYICRTTDISDLPIDQIYNSRGIAVHR